jgi:hypothetical protein
VVAFQPLQADPKIVQKLEPQVRRPRRQSLGRNDVCHVSQFDQFEVFCLPIPR